MSFVSPASVGIGALASRALVGAATVAALALLPALTGAQAASKFVARAESSDDVGVERACLRVLRPVARGQAFVSADLHAERCGADDAVQRAHYDRDSALVRAPANLVAGDAVAPFAGTLFADVRQGDKLALIYRDGPIAISRSGVAARDSKTGAAVRVALRDGAVITAPASSAPAPAALMPSSTSSSSLAGETP